MPAHIILPNLSIGDAVDARSAATSLKAGLIVNCTRDIPFFSPDACVGIRLPVDDDLRASSMQKMYDCVRTVCGAIHTARQEGRHVFVHCAAGRQRSCCVVAAYLILYLHMHKAAAIQFVKSKRPVAFEPSVNFDQVLDKL